MFNAQNFLNMSGDEWGLALKQYLGTVITQFREKTLLWSDGMVIARQMITQGQSHQFLMFGDTPDPEEQPDGAELLGQQFEFADGTLTVDKRLICHKIVPTQRLAISHFDPLRPLAEANGTKLAEYFDKILFRVGVLAARTAAQTKNGLSIHTGGVSVSRSGGDITTVYADSSTGSANFRSDVAELGQKFDEADVPQDPGVRRLYIGPYIRRILRHETAIFNTDYSREMRNSLNQRVVGELEGFLLMEPTNNLPSANFSTGASKYQGDFRYNGATGRPAALALCSVPGKKAIGFLQLEGITPYADVDKWNNNVRSKAQMMIGAGVMYPPCAGEIRVTS